MAQELIYTSVPRCLSGHDGFGTVAMTRGMSPQMVKLLEGLVAYTPVFEHYDPNSVYNPASVFHFPVTDGRNRYELLARVCSCGLDYTKRSNKIGHFILLSEEERALFSDGPSSLLYVPSLFCTEWNGEPKYFPEERALEMQTVAPAKASAWEQDTGDAGWAAWLAESFLQNPDKPCFVIFDPLQHTNLQALVAESLMLLPKRKRWTVIWNTYMTATVTGLPSCNWRFCTDNPSVMRTIGCVPDANILDLRKPGLAGDSRLAQCARTGDDPHQEAASATLDFSSEPSTRSQDESTLAELMQKQQEAKKSQELAELELAAKQSEAPRTRTTYRLRNLDDPLSQQESPVSSQVMNAGLANQEYAPLPPNVLSQPVPNNAYMPNSGSPSNGSSPTNIASSNNSFQRIIIALFIVIIALLLIIIAGAGLMWHNSMAGKQSKTGMTSNTGVNSVDPTQNNGAHETKDKGGIIKETIVQKEEQEEDEQTMHSDDLETSRGDGKKQGAFDLKKAKGESERVPTMPLSDGSSTAGVESGDSKTDDSKNNKLNNGDAQKNSVDESHSRSLNGSTGKVQSNAGSEQTIPSGRIPLGGNSSQKTISPYDCRRLQEQIISLNTFLGNRQEFKEVYKKTNNRNNGKTITSENYKNMKDKYGNWLKDIKTKCENCENKKTKESFQYFLVQHKQNIIAIIGPDDYSNLIKGLDD